MLREPELLKADSPRGVGEITEDGRRARQVAFAGIAGVDGASFVNLVQLWEVTAMAMNLYKDILSPKVTGRSSGQGARCYNGHANFKTRCVDKPKTCYTGAVNEGGQRRCVRQNAKRPGSWPR